MAEVVEGVKRAKEEGESESNSGVRREEEEVLAGECIDMDEEGRVLRLAIELVGRSDFIDGFFSSVFCVAATVERLDMETFATIGRVGSGRPGVDVGVGARTSTFEIFRRIVGVGGRGIVVLTGDLSFAGELGLIGEPGVA